MRGIGGKLLELIIVYSCGGILVFVMCYYVCLFMN